MGSILSNKFMIIGLAAFVGMVGWYVLKGDTGTGALLVTEQVAAAPSEAERDLVATLLQLRAVTLDGTIFSDPAFQSLLDYGIDIVPEPVGRTNPFAPLPGQPALVPNEPAAR